jgi:hypothetical protein
MYKARQISSELKKWISKGQFLIQEPIQKFDLEREFKPLDVRTKEEVCR